MRKNKFGAFICILGGLFLLAVLINHKLLSHPFLQALEFVAVIIGGFIYYRDKGRWSYALASGLLFFVSCVFSLIAGITSDLPLLSFFAIIMFLRFIHLCHIKTEVVNDDKEAEVIPEQSKEMSKYEIEQYAAMCNAYLEHQDMMAQYESDGSSHTPNK